MPIAVLYIHHSGIFGGASRSLFELIRGFPEGAVAARLVSQRGTVARMALESGLEVIDAAGISQLDHSKFGHYRGRRWLLLLREFAFLLPTILALLKARRRWPDTQIVHVNEVTMLPAIWIARRIFACPLVIHVRSVQHTSGWRRRLVERELSRASAVIAIDETVRASLPTTLPVEVVHNGLATNPAPRPLRTAGQPIRIGMVGNLLALKGVHEFIAAASICKSHGLGVRFVLIGGNARTLGSLSKRLLRLTGFGQDIEHELKSQVNALGVGDMVEFRGFDPDLDRVYRSIDVLCFPSQLDAPGRPVFEAAFWSVPSIVALSRPRPDTLVHGETGLAISTGSAESIADAIEHFCNIPSDIERMGSNARLLAERNFDSRRNANRISGIYRRALESTKGPQ